MSVSAVFTLEKYAKDAKNEAIEEENELIKVREMMKIKTKISKFKMSPFQPKMNNGCNGGHIFPECVSLS